MDKVTSFQLTELKYSKNILLKILCALGHMTEQYYSLLRGEQVINFRLRTLITDKIIVYNIQTKTLPK